jgi:hypothetical protein
MTRRTWTCLAALAAVATTFGFSSPARAADKTATGTWNWTFNRNGEDVKMSVTLKQDGEKLTGKFKPPQGDEVDIKDGKVKDGEVTFDVVRERDGNTFTVHYTGKLDGDTLKGKSEVEINGEKRMRDWEAKRGD